ncbi:MAG: M28 family peptidase [Chitinophagales bacterium]
MRNKFIPLLLLFVLPLIGFGQTVTDILNQVSSEGTIQMVRELSGEDSTVVGGIDTIIVHRVSSRGNNLAADYIKERLESYGLTVTDDVYSPGTTGGRNIYATQLGTVNPDSIYIICGHYDAVANYCADDNASAVAAILEAARIMSGYEFENTIIYAFWDQEEVGLIGAKNYANKAAANGDGIIAVLNMDMMAYENDGDNRFDIDVRNIANSYQIRDDLIDLTSTYNFNLVPFVVDPGTSASDHSAFWSKGYSAVLFGEAWSTGDRCPKYHTADDRINLFDFEYYHNMVKLSIAYMATKGVLVPVSSIQSLDISKMNVYPNPSNGLVNIDFGELFEGDLVLYSLSGYEISYQKVSKEYNVQINLMECESAIYLLKIKNMKGESAVIKLVRE